MLSGNFGSSPSGTNGLPMGKVVSIVRCCLQGVASLRLVENVTLRFDGREGVVE